MVDGFSVELVGAPGADATVLSGWAVVRRDANLPRRIISVYLTCEQAESAAERLRKKPDPSV